MGGVGFGACAAGGAKKSSVRERALLPPPPPPPPLPRAERCEAHVEEVELSRESEGREGGGVGPAVKEYE